MVKLDVGSRGIVVDESNGFADNKGQGLGFRLPHNLGGRSAALALMQEFMRLCSAQHKHIYVVFAVMLRSGLMACGLAALSPAYTT